MRHQRSAKVGAVTRRRANGSDPPRARAGRHQIGEHHANRTRFHAYRSKTVNAASRRRTPTSRRRTVGQSARAFLEDGRCNSSLAALSQRVWLARVISNRRPAARRHCQAPRRRRRSPRAVVRTRANAQCALELAAGEAALPARSLDVDRSGESARFRGARATKSRPAIGTHVDSAELPVTIERRHARPPLRRPRLASARM